jgi:acetyl esterase
MTDEPHPQVRTVLDMLEQQPVPPVQDLSVATAREQFEQASTMTAGPDVGDVRDLEFEGPGGPVPVRLYLPETAGPHPVLVFFHGGGFVLGGVETHDQECRHLVTEAECAVVSVDYRRAPEHTFPAALEDAYAAVQWVVDAGEHMRLDTDRIAIGGDSAGANLTAGVTLTCQDRGGPDIQRQLLVYPAVASPAVHDFDSYVENAEGYFLETGAMEWFLDSYVADTRDHRNEYFAPLLASDLEGVPPASVVTAGFDPLRDEGVAYAENLEAAGVDVAHYHYEEMIHGFFGMIAMVDAAGDAVAELAADLQDAFAE